MKDLPIKNGKIPLKPLAEAIGLSGYQALQRKAKKHGILSGKFIKAEDIQKAITLYRDLIVNKYGEGRYRELMDAASFTEPKKEEVVKTDDFSFLGNPKIILRLAAVAMIVQSFVMLRFLMEAYGINYRNGDLLLMDYLHIILLLVEAICFQSTVLFLAPRKGFWGVMWVTIFGIYDLITASFVVGFLDAASFKSFQSLVAALPVPFMIGAFVTLFKDKINK